MSKPSKKSEATPRTRKPSWRSLPDELILCMSQRGWTTAESLHPDENTTMGCVYGNPQSREIIAAWQFRCPVVVVPNV
jgi:hypothetical protein